MPMWKLLLEHVTQFITDMRSHISADIADGTLIPDVYARLLAEVDRAEELCEQWALDQALDVLWEINLDVLEIVDEFDDAVSEVLHKLRKISASYRAVGDQMPADITDAFAQLRRKVESFELG